MSFFDFFRSPDINAGVRRFRETPGAVLLDVREADEYAGGHIPGSVNLPLSVIDSAETVLPDRSVPVLAYCLSGSRSGRAVSRLHSLGYAKAENIGGISSYSGKLEQD